ncbi:MAG: beta-mannosidase [Ferruginibacter sp.]|nr:beta-mannosidase [Ferruginibacter sp.]
MLFGAANAQTADKTATIETQNLLRNLKKLLSKGIMFGHQDDLAYGVEWKYEPGRSDIKDVTGEYPAVYGWDLAGLEKGSKVNIDGVPFDKMREFIQQGYGRGGVITISWHLDHPLTGKNAWDTTHGAVTAVLPGGAANAIYTAWLDRVADFSLSLKGVKGELIPILFRPFHELSGNWFWWTKNTCSPEEFKQLWIYTFDYLRDIKKVHNFLYVYNTGGNFNSAEQFLERYPGEHYVDVISFDDYQSGDPAKDNRFVKELSFKLNILDSLATELHKIPALGETGYVAIPYPEWWTKVLWKAIADHRVSYVLLWRNHGMLDGKMHYYAPYKGQVSERDFRSFYKLEKVFFENKTRQQNLYDNP